MEFNQSENFRRSIWEGQLLAITFFVLLAPRFTRAYNDPNTVSVDPPDKCNLPPADCTPGRQSHRKIEAIC